MIDLKHEARNFAAMNLPGSTGDGASDDIRWAYSLYNKAIQFIKKGYDDMARQNLKKAIGLNPDFYPARMLLGVCLFANGDRVGAMRMFNAIKDMRYKRLALSYYDYLTEEVDKPVSQSGTRLILKDLYRAAAASEKTLSDVTKTVEEPLLVQDEVKKPRPEIKLDSIEKKKTIEDAGELESLTMGELNFDDVSFAPIGNEREEEPSPEKNDDTEIEDLEIPHFVSQRPQTVITSRKNDGVVEEIVKQKREEAQRMARYSGAEKRPFEFDHVYKKQIFSENPEYVQQEEQGSNEEKTVTDSSRDNIIISVASVLVLIFLIVTSVLLMQNVTENRKLKNELDDLKKLYIESQITPTPKPDVIYTFEPEATATPQETSETTPEATIDTTPEYTEVQ